MPAVVVFEGEFTGTSGRVPIGGVNNYIKGRHEQRVKSETYYKVLTSVQKQNHVSTFICQKLDVVSCCVHQTSSTSRHTNTSLVADVKQK